MYGVVEVKLHKEDEFERLSVRIQCLLEMQKWLVATQNGESCDSKTASENEEFSLHYEYKVFGKQNYRKFIALVNNTGKQSKAILKRKNWRVSPGVGVSLSVYQSMRREEVIRELNRDHRRSVKDPNNVANNLHQQ